MKCIKLKKKDLAQIYKSTESIFKINSKDFEDLCETPSTAKPVPTPCSPRPPRETFKRFPRFAFYVIDQTFSYLFLTYVVKSAV